MDGASNASKTLVATAPIRDRNRSENGETNAHWKRRGERVKKNWPLAGPVPKIADLSTGKFLIPIKYRNCNFFSVS